MSSVLSAQICFYILFFFNDTATTEIYTLSLHDALPICFRFTKDDAGKVPAGWEAAKTGSGEGDRKSTRLNSSHQIISYAVFCLKKKNYKQLIAKADSL